MASSVRARMLKDIAADLSIVCVISEPDAIRLTERLTDLLDSGLRATLILEKLAELGDQPLRMEIPERMNESNQP